MSKLPSSRWMLRDEDERISMVSPGCARRSASEARAATATAVGIAPSATWPVSPSRAAETSWRIASASCRMRRAQTSAISPSVVKPAKRLPRLTTGAPSFCSRLRMRVEKAGWLMPQASAARAKWPWRARAVRISMSRRSSMIPVISDPDAPCTR